MLWALTVAIQVGALNFDPAYKVSSDSSCEEDKKKLVQYSPTTYGVTKFRSSDDVFRLNEKFKEVSWIWGSIVGPPLGPLKVVVIERWPISISAGWKAHFGTESPGCYSDHYTLSFLVASKTVLFLPKVCRYTIRASKTDVTLTVLAVRAGHCSDIAA